MIKAKELRVGNLVLINGLITEVSLLVLKHIIEENIQFTVDFLSDSQDLKTITPYIPTQDPYLDRSFILAQLGISKEQDEEMQQKHK